MPHYNIRESQMMRRSTIVRRGITVAVACTFIFAPAAQAAPANNSAKPTNSAASSHDEKTRIEYRSEADRLAFEKLGRYIHTSDDGTVSENIPDVERRANKDAAARIDEFISIANASQANGETPPITTYGNETKIDGWGPVERVYISHDALSKVSKVVGAGGGIAGVAAVLASEGIAGPAGWVAAGLTALAAAGNLCDWNDQGIIIWRVPGLPVPACTPQK